MENNKTFKMTYSARQQEEIMAIRKKYAAPEETKLERLRAMDAAVGKKAVTVSISVGIAGALLLGAGMSLIMSEFGNALGTLALPLGIIAGLAGLAVLACAYPLYSRTLKKERKKIAAEIIRLTDELMQ